MERPLDKYKRLLKDAHLYKTLCEKEIDKLNDKIDAAELEKVRLGKRYVDTPQVKEIIRNIKEWKREIQYNKELVTYHESEIKTLEQNIYDITIADPNNIQSANQLTMAAQDHRKSSKSAVNPLDRLSAHGMGFRGMFLDKIQGFAGVPDAEFRQKLNKGGRKKTLKRKKHH